MKENACIVLDSSTQRIKGEIKNKKLNKKVKYVVSQATTLGSNKLKHILIRTSNPDCSHQAGDHLSVPDTVVAGLINLIGWPQRSEKHYLDAEPLITACTACHSHAAIITGLEHSTEY